MKKVFILTLSCLTICFVMFASACSGEEDNRQYENQNTYYISFLGDSITYGQGCTSTSKRFTDLIGKQDFVSMAQNVGFSGATVGTSGTVMDSYAFVNRYSQISGSADLIFILGGTNDYGATTGAVPLGALGDSGTDTFYGAYATLLDNISVRYSDAIIVTATPFQRDNDVVGYPEGVYNSYGNTLEEYCEAIKILSEQYGVKCIDFYNFEGMRVSDETFATYFEDGLHPNDAANAIIAEYLVPIFKDVLGISE